MGDISSHFNKLLERSLTGRINKYLDLHNIIGQEQEGFRTKKNTVRSLYMLHLSLEQAKASKLPTALLNIDLEKAFDSVWISGLLYKLPNYNIAGRMFRILEAFLRNRHVFIELREYKSHTLLVNMGYHKGACFLRYFVSYFSMTS